MEGGSRSTDLLSLTLVASPTGHKRRTGGVDGIEKVVGGGEEGLFLFGGLLCVKVDVYVYICVCKGTDVDMTGLCLAMHLWTYLFLLGGWWRWLLLLLFLLLVLRG